MEEIKKLIDVKSIITIILTFAFIYLNITQKMNGEFLTVYTTVISFYFGTQYQKQANKNEKLENNIKKIEEIEIDGKH